jgi:hypothetical protein
VDKDTSKELKGKGEDVGRAFSFMPVFYYNSSPCKINGWQGITNPSLKKRREKTIYVSPML